MGVSIGSLVEDLGMPVGDGATGNVGRFREEEDSAVDNPLHGGRRVGMTVLTNATDFVGEAIRDTVARLLTGVRPRDRKRSATMAIADMMLLIVKAAFSAFDGGHLCTMP